MKKINIIYWISTILLILVMLSSALGTFFIKSQESADMLNQMGYKPYVMQFLAVAKLLGIIVLLIPGWTLLKEWVYAGFTFDLVGATFSMIAVGMGPDKWGLMPVFIIILAVSYIYFHKRLKLKSAVTTDAAV
jgi:hypothetical protein